MNHLLPFRTWLPLMAAVILAFVSGCRPDAMAPGITITPVTSESVPGGTVEFTISVSADEEAKANLVSVSLNGEEIKSYSDETQSDEFTYVYTFPEGETSDQTLNFTVTDDAEESADQTASALVQYVQPDFTLADFGSFKASTAKWGDWWESADPATIDLNDYNGATYAGGDVSTNMYVTSRGNFANADFWDFEATAPGDSESSLMMTRSVLEKEDGTTEWGGYMLPVFGYYDADNGQNALPESEMNAVKSNARVIAVDVYFEEDGSSPVSFSELSAFRLTDDTQGAIKDQSGVKVQLRLGSLKTYQARESGGDDGFFLIREAYITAPGEWQTLYFTTEDPGEGGVGMNGEANEVDMLWFAPVYGYPDFDYGKLYVKNLRITNPE